MSYSDIVVGQHWVTDIFLLLAPGGEEMCLDKKHEEGLEGPVFGMALCALVQIVYSNNNTHAFHLRACNG